MQRGRQATQHPSEHTQKYTKTSKQHTQASKKIAQNCGTVASSSEGPPDIPQLPQMATKKINMQFRSLWKAIKAKFI